MNEKIQRLLKKLEGDGPIEKHIILLKLTEALSNAPDFGKTPVLKVGTPQRQWISEVAALLSRLGIEKKVAFSTSFGMLNRKRSIYHVIFS